MRDTLLQNSSQYTGKIANTRKMVTNLLVGLHE